VHNALWGTLTSLSQTITPPASFAGWWRSSDRLFTWHLLGEAWTKWLRA